jgi:hypothetical protein
MSPALAENKSFAQLEAAESVGTLDVLATLKVYGSSGAAINGLVVTAIIDRTTLTDMDLVQLRQAALVGVNHPQRSHDIPKEKQEYQDVVAHIEAYLGRRYIARMQTTAAGEGLDSLVAGGR